MESMLQPYHSELIAYIWSNIEVNIDPGLNKHKLCQQAEWTWTTLAQPDAWRNIA